ncbi:Uri superfamily endonuclease [Halorhabdus sp. SVX81]|uniref:GIY-YIG nuclease family protein n=1 Tax=Halorhabdus sp. SVX81 TaxID=2978283 RepID=UPI0023DA0C8A|nr:GIY-YIG nuclease family protein [Halorhabdus sp. SVX81]WEL16351.1 Uri superfamily endonuclease [Halorhabdus sp. SVX81]
MTAQGTYTLLVTLDQAATITFGAAGERELAAGGYAYTGSAFGTGGFGRIDRHRELAAGERDVRHWHVDYLLGHPGTELTDVVKTVDEGIECPVAREIAAEAQPVAGIGASDCDCNTHLAYAPDVAELRRTVEGAHDAAVGR